ncbi:hypothetical protein AO501_27110 [Mycobacterium gordonae]|uniref:Uncharacterized protein n=1 Tax=Mycobacterium gordonae TaxID=1778 RepID=A0A0Q2LS65_MYCGO|nr:hypothetical protein [Mycobacterium gordonae]KQH78857.1 hypothetical protein AO501_27110 [Mycobacterium gordonae]
MVVIDYDGDDGSDVRSADTQTLAGDHDYAVFGDSPLNALGAGRWGRRMSMAKLEYPLVAS